MTRWKLFWYALRQAGWLQIFSYAIFLFVAMVVIQFIMSLFGYCLTYQEMSCEAWGNYIFNVPLFGAAITLIFGLFSRFGALLTTIHDSPDLRKSFGLDGDSIKNIHTFMFHRGLNTIFLPRYLLLVLLMVIFRALGAGWIDGLLWAVLLGVVSNMQTLNLFAQSKDVGTSKKSEYVGKPATVNNTKKIVKRVLTITMWTMLVFFLLMIIIIFASAYAP